MLKKLVQHFLPLFEKAPPLPAAISETNSSYPPPYPVHIIRNSRARRYLLRLNEHGHPVLTIPRRGNETEALNFLKRSESWLNRRRQEWKSRTDSKIWQDGTLFYYRGESVTLNVLSKTFPSGIDLCFADQVVSIKHPLSDYRPLILEHLKNLAQSEIPPRVWELAKFHHITISRVTLRNQKTRWGSCSSRGAISLNWRLIQTPPFVTDYIIIHELMHRRQMNHSRAFWSEVAQAYPQYREAEKWLKASRLPLTDAG